MKRLVNPFRYVAGGRALALGLGLILVTGCWLDLLGLVQDSYLHFAPSGRVAPASLLRVVGMQLAMWFVPALLLYGCGRLLSHSKIRAIDLFGTTALAQGPLLLVIVPLSVPAVQTFLDRITGQLLAGALPASGDLTLAVLCGLWSLAAVALFYVRGYQAYAVSCNLRGPRAVCSYILVVVAVTVATQYL